MYQQNFVLAEIEQIFADEISAAGGSITGRHALPSRLFLRSVLVLKAEIFPGDVVKAGVALRADETQLQVTPYVFRRICGNGMIREQRLQSRDFQVQQVFEQRAQFVNLVRECAAEQVFHETISQLQQARRDKVGLPRARRLLTGLDLGDEALYRHATIAETDLLEILIRFVREKDDSRYGLLNAITSLARDTQDPAKRWQLEALGGAVATCRPPRDDRFLKPRPARTSSRLTAPCDSLAEQWQQPTTVPHRSAAEPQLCSNSF